MKKLKNKQGYTIIEIIVTLAILGIVIVPLITMFIMSQKINNEGTKEYKSIQIAQKYMEEIKSMEIFNYSTEGYTQSSEGANNIYIKSITEPGTDYDVDIIITGAKEDTSTPGTTIDFDATLIINTNSVQYKDASNDRTLSITGDINLQVRNTGIIINTESEITSASLSKIKVELKRTANINITNNLDDEVNLYIYNIDGSNLYECNVNVEEGKVNRSSNNNINPDMVTTADNILYNIEIKITKGGEVINTINGTTIFKNSPE